jgi:4-diphosphocytidyl-2-C-methyl-D-erythritol kinase
MIMAELILKSPAKINLFLRVLQRRPDGYHNLASLLQAVSLYDTLHFSLSDQDQLTCNKPEIPTDSKNLVLKAADLFRRKTGLKFGLKVHLEKNIPHEAGLGGGSSNAASTLWALNQMHGFPASLEDLIVWSGDIGSDITFFLSQGTAYCTGRGEIMQTLDPLPNQKLWIAKPAEGLSTPAVFKALDWSTILSKDPLNCLEVFYKGMPDYFNDLEPTALQIKPSLRKVKENLLKIGFDHVMMTGSGTAFFCLGKRPNPELEGVDFYPVYFIRRETNLWY